MAFGIAIILLFLGWCMVKSKEDSPETEAAAAREKNAEEHPQFIPMEYLLIYGVYAYYAHQPKRSRPKPFEDAVRHARLEMMRRGCSPSSAAASWCPIEQVTPELEAKLNDPSRVLDSLNSGIYGHDPGPLTELPYGKWPFQTGPFKSAWIDWVGYLNYNHPSYRHQKPVKDKFYYSALFNRLAEWYYLVMFRDEFLASKANIRDALIDENSFGKQYYSESEIDRAFNDLLAEIQGIVACGDQWDAEIHAHQAQVAAQAQAEKQMREAPGEARRKRLLESGSLTPTGLEAGSPEWARQQLKEKYGIDYPPKDENQS